MRIGVPQEIKKNENRIAATPETIVKLQRFGFDVFIEHGAGQKSSFHDDAYIKAGAKIHNREYIWGCDIIIKVNAPTEDEIELIREGAILICFFWPSQNKALINNISQRNASVLAMDCVPRLSRSQTLDALSSMAHIAGYRAVVEASYSFGKLFNGQITAAGNIPPAKVFVIGAGVAGLAAIAAASSMGAIVSCFDNRHEVKAHVESMGAEFLQLDHNEYDRDSLNSGSKDMKIKPLESDVNLLMEQCRKVDIVITTAQIPNKSAPCLIRENIIIAMKSGSIIVDLAAQTGGNCECTIKDEVIVKHDVTIIGFTDLPNRLPSLSSQLYGTNIVNLIKLLSPRRDGRININFNDEIIRALTIIRKGEITWPPPTSPKSIESIPTESNQLPQNEESTTSHQWIKSSLMISLAILIGVIAHSSPPIFLEHITVFSLASIVGYYVIWNVRPALHTPLMSITNAISGIIVIGGLIQLSNDKSLTVILSAIAITVGMINIVGGFAVTRRMINMFRLD